MKPAAETYKRRLKLARDERGWSQQRLATELGMSLGAVRKWEGMAEETIPRPPVQHRIAELLGYPVAWFFDTEQNGNVTQLPLAHLARLADAVERQQAALDQISALAATNVDRFEALGDRMDDALVRLARIETQLQSQQRQRRSG